MCMFRITIYIYIHTYMSFRLLGFMYTCIYARLCAFVCLFRINLTFRMFMITHVMSCYCGHCDVYILLFQTVLKLTNDVIHIPVPSSSTSSSSIPVFKRIFPG